jgi:hypothetical protein
VEHPSRTWWQERVDKRPSQRFVLAFVFGLALGLAAVFFVARFVLAGSVAV